MAVNWKHIHTLSALLITFSLFSLSLSLSLSDPEDITTLLAFKSSSDPFNSLSSWSSNASISNPYCSWLGVTCDPSTLRVTKLVLDHLNLTGSIQTLASLTRLRHLSLHHNRLSAAPDNLTSWPNLKHLYLSHNLFAGKFPTGILHLHRLRRLDLSHNRFSGRIPLAELTQLPHLLTLRLEFNSFTGALDSGGISSTSISDFNVSGNDLSGKIPDWLSSFPATSFAGNDNLCGEPITTNCLNRSAMNGSVQTRRHLSSRVVLTIITIDAAAVILALVTITCCCYKFGNGYRYRHTKLKRKDHKLYNVDVVREESVEMVQFEGCSKGLTKVDELLKASAELLGKGCVGATYKVVMDGGNGAVVVKRVRERKRRRDVDGVLRVIGGLRHPNVVSLTAYHSSKDEVLLVYDFLPNGSLHSLLHGNRGPGRTPLGWTTRLNLAMESAQGLAFLHSLSYPKLSHGHLTSSNIIVNHLGKACISDIALHYLFPATTSPNNSCNAKFLQKCDVYSFGVVLLEILMGKSEAIGGEMPLANWVQLMVREKGGIWEVLDFELLSYREMEEEMVALLQVAMLCLAPLPKDRPKMGIVHKMIEDIRTKSSGKGWNSFSLDDLSSDSSPLC